MGRRSINTTKSGKYMNPTDQARKEARKKELKKNKKQRQMVRAAVLKGKDPAQLIEEMEKIDEMEYNVFQPSPLNEKVLREKRKKLKETFDRVMRLYHNDDPELWADLKRKEVDYERRRNKKVQYFESVRHAQTVQIDDIPLPEMTDQPPPVSTQQQQQPQQQLAPPPFNNAPGRIPLPASAVPKEFPKNVSAASPTAQGLLPKPLSEPKSIANDNNISEAKKKESPGCPPGPPPNLEEMHELDSDYESESDDDSDDKCSPLSKRFKSTRYTTEKRSSDRSDDRNSDDSEIEVPKPTSVQQRILAIAGQKYDDFMKELENVHKKKDQDRTTAITTTTTDDRQNTSQDKSSKSANDEDDDDDNSHDSKSSTHASENEESVKHEAKPNENALQPRPDHPITIPNISLVPAPPMPPPLVKLPSGPPPPPMGMPPSMMFRPPPMRPGLQSLGIRMPPGPPGMMPRLRMPPGPPPGMPPARLMHHQHKKMISQHLPPHLNMLAAAPLLTKDTKGMTTITAKPQIRNLSADVTRFVPSTLRVKREDKKVQKPKSFLPDYNRHHQTEAAVAKGTTKDDAYMQFMREMQGLL